MSTVIVHVNINKENKNNKSSLQLTCLQNSLLIIIVDTPEKDISNVDRKSDMIKVHTSSVKSSLSLFSCTIRAMYSIFNRAQKQSLMLKSYLPGVNLSVYPKSHNENIAFLKN